MKYRGIAKWVLMLLLGCITGVVQAANLTPAQQQLLQQMLPQLSPDQQAKAQALLQQDQSGSVTQPTPQFPQTVLPRPVSPQDQQMSSGGIHHFQPCFRAEGICIKNMMMKGPRFHLSFPSNDKKFPPIKVVRFFQIF